VIWLAWISTDWPLPWDAASFPVQITEHPALSFWISPA